MHKNKSIVLALALTVIALFGFKQYEQTTSKETMTIIVSNMGSNMLVNISQSGGSRFEQKRIKAQSEFDYSEVLKIIKEHQNNGWQIRSSNYTKTGEPYPQDNTCLYFLLEK